MVGVIVVVVLIFVINAWYHDYKAASIKTQTARETTSTASTSATSVVPVSGQTVNVLVPGLALSSQAATGTPALRVLKKGEQLLLVGVTANNWLQLRDGAGKFGYVRNDPAAIKVQK